MDHENYQNPGLSSKYVPWFSVIFTMCHSALIKTNAFSQVDLPLIDGDYVWAEGKSVSKHDSTVIALETDDPNITGYGEVVPLGPNYLPSYANGVRTGLAELAPKILGQNPTQISVLNRLMDFELKGHPYVKSPIDLACWDILGKVAGLPVSTLLGGRHQEEVLLYRTITQRPADEMAQLVKKYKGEGYTRFQLKLGSDADEDIRRIRICRSVLDPGDVLVGDANTGNNHNICTVDAV